MKDRSHLLLCTFLAVNTHGLAAPRVGIAESDKERELRTLCETYASAYKAKDASTLGNLFVGRNVVLMPPNQAAAVGPEAIAARYQKFFETSSSSGVEKLETEGELHDFANVGDLLVITSSNEKYKYLIVLVHKSGQGWGIARLIWNRNGT